MTTTTEPGRTAQRRRTRRAIVDAAMTLLSEGLEPTVNEVAERADVSRRTIYLHFPALDQLVLDATIGLLNVDTDAALQQVSSVDVRERLAALVNATYRTMEASLPLGRKLIKLTVDRAIDVQGVSDQAPRRGYRRVAWLEWVLEPVQDRLTSEQLEDLVSSLALIIGWESFIVLLDVRGLSVSRAREVTLRAAMTLLEAQLRTLDADA